MQIQDKQMQENKNTKGEMTKKGEENELEEDGGEGEIMGRLKRV